MAPMISSIGEGANTRNYQIHPNTINSVGFHQSSEVLTIFVHFVPFPSQKRIMKSSTSANIGLGSARETTKHYKQF